MKDALPKPNKFVWPPRAMAEADLGPPPQTEYWKKQPAREAPLVQTRPHAVADALAAQPLANAVPAPSRETAVASPAAAPTLSWRRQVETVWLGLTRATLSERAIDAQWSPDPPSVYCSRCGGSVGLHEETGEGCRACRGKRLPWSRFVRLGEYHGLIRDVVHEIKFTRWRRVGSDAGRLLGKQLVPLLGSVPREKLILVPVPSTFRRRMVRGIDHTLVLARGVQEVTGGRIVRALARAHRPSQVGLPMTERRRNVARTMRLRGRPPLEGCTVVVIDDVRTTGATMLEACRALAKGLKGQGRAAGEIWAAVLGVAVERAASKASRSQDQLEPPQA